MSSEHAISDGRSTPPGGALPVFFDEGKHRWTGTKRIVPFLALAIAAIAAGFVISLISFPLVQPASITNQKLPPLSMNPMHPALESSKSAQERFQYHKVVGDLRQWVAAHPRGTSRDIHEFWRPTLKPYSIVAAFYVNWEASSLASFQKHASQLTHLFPEWLHLGGDGVTVLPQEDKQKQFPQLLKMARENHVAVLPLLNNFEPETPTKKGFWDPDRAERLLKSPANRQKVIQSLLQFVQSNGCQGINLDFENLRDDDDEGQHDDEYLAAFVREITRVFHRYGLMVVVDVGVDQSGLGELAAAADYLVPMVYDQHGEDSTSGPIAGQDWFQNRMADFFSEVPPSRTILGVGNYAYDWTNGKPTAEEMSVGSAVVLAKENVEAPDREKSEGVIRMEPGSLNSHFAYYDEDNKPHDVWMLDALSAYNELRASRQWEPAGAALWVIGEEDRALWQFYAAGHLEQNIKDIQPTKSLSYIPGDYEVDPIGDGEVLDVTAAASAGTRTLKQDSTTGLINSEQYVSYPSPWVVHGEPTKRRLKELALTFDDGPDGRYTPQVLDTLSSFHVPGTFFLVGDNADGFPDLVRREWSEGHEIGNHTFFHPNLAEVGTKRLRYEVEANERLIEVLTGHSTRLFRAPYVVDTDPNTPAELAPLVTVSQMGFVTVGSKIDPKDYLPTSTPQQIANDVIAARDTGNIILLHDAGGDRGSTVGAMQLFIPRLQKMGYRFVTVTDLIGGPGNEAAARSKYFPPTTEKTWPHASDYMAFMSWFWVRRVLSILFTLAIVLGLSRVVFIGILALLQARREARLHFNADYRPQVTVLVAAFNEEKVIARTIDALLQSDYPDLEIIVVDDGSTDGTSDIVRTHFGRHSRVRLIRKENGGKASALNLGLETAAGEVIVGIDADTLFVPDTVSMLVRHFEDPNVGAVAGNVKVGNPVNLLTRWQSLEYITGQNFDRRAYDYLNCITVVPGAVGAWRQSALQEAGGYLGDTLAEDTDLTYRVRRLGYQIRTESRAVAYTEAPERIREFRKQRFRWTFGTLQCLWKHQDAMFRPQYGAFGLFALPSLWFYAILLPLISPVMDLMIVWSLFDGYHSFARTGFYYGLFFLSELVAALFALRLDREGFGLAFWLFFQRFLYRQLMYQIVWKALFRAWAGSIQGWGKLARTGRVQSTAPTLATTRSGSKGV